MKRCLLYSVFCLISSFICYSQPGFSCPEPIVIGSLPYSTTDTNGNYGNTLDNPGNGCVTNGAIYMGGKDVFYSYTATTSGYVRVTMTPSGEGSSIHIFDGCDNVGLVCLAAVANNSTMPRVINQLEVIAGHTYIFVISKKVNIYPSFDYTLEVENLNCYYPTQLSVIDVTPNTVTLSWDNPAQATSLKC